MTLVCTRVQNCAQGTLWEAPTGSVHEHGDAVAFGPYDKDRCGLPFPVGYKVSRMNRYRLKQQT